MHQCGVLCFRARYRPDSGSQAFVLTRLRRIANEFQTSQGQSAAGASTCRDLWRLKTLLVISVLPLNLYNTNCSFKCIPEHRQCSGPSPSLLTMSS